MVSPGMILQVVKGWDDHSLFSDFCRWHKWWCMFIAWSFWARSGPWAIIGDLDYHRQNISDLTQQRKKRFFWNPKKVVGKECFTSLRIQICPKKVIFPIIRWDFSTIHPTGSGGVWILRWVISCKNSHGTWKCTQKEKEKGHNFLQSTPSFCA